MGQPCEVLRFLEWRIDNNDAATLRWRHIGAQRHPAIDRDRLDAAIALEIVCEQSVGLGLELAGDETILWTQKRARERGRARIDGEHIFAFRRCALDPLIPSWSIATWSIPTWSIPTWGVPIWGMPIWGIHIWVIALGPRTCG